MSEKAEKRILEGPLAWEIFRFGIPLAVGAILQTTFNLVDAYLIAQLPKDEVGPAIGALGVCDQLAAVGTIFSYGVSTAAATIVSNHKGKGDLEAVKHTAWQSFLVVLVLVLVLLLRREEEEEEKKMKMSESSCSRRRRRRKLKPCPWR